MYNARFCKRFAGYYRMILKLKRTSRGTIADIQQNHRMFAFSTKRTYKLISCSAIAAYHIISYHIVLLKWQNRLKVGTDKPKLKVKMQSVSDEDVRKRLLEQPRFELAAKGVFRLGRCYILRQGVPGLCVSIWESTATDG